MYLTGTVRHFRFPTVQQSDGLAIQGSSSPAVQRASKLWPNSPKIQQCVQGPSSPEVQQIQKSSRPESRAVRRAKCKNQQSSSSNVHMSSSSAVQMYRCPAVQQFKCSHVQESKGPREVDLEGNVWRVTERRVGRSTIKCPLSLTRDSHCPLFFHSAR